MSGADPSSTSPARTRRLAAEQPILRCTGQFHPGRLTQCAGRHCPRRGHRHSVMRRNIGLSTGIGPLLPSIFFEIIRSYGTSPWFVERVHALYDHATASVQINESMKGRIPIRCGVRRGCPSVWFFFALCLHPILRALEDS